MAFALFAGCSEEPSLRSRDDIFRERQQLPAVYLTEKSGKKVIAPIGRGVFLDEATGELCYPALACQNQECPGRSDSGEPFLFILPDPGLRAGPDGIVQYDPKNATAPKDGAGGCPQCMKLRNLATETAADRIRWSSYVTPYVPPETAQRQRELDEEMREQLKRFERRRDGAP